MLIFGPVCLTEHEAWVEDRKYVHSNGVLYAVRNREADADYVEGEKWLLKNWRGAKCKNKGDQQLFTETVGEMLKIVQKAVMSTGPRRQKRRPSVLRTDAATCISDSSEEPVVAMSTATAQKPPARVNLAKAVQLMPVNSLLHTMMTLTA